ncbi:hypothetical protein Pmar_PMAR007103, partial [Perkinsus marinus ATCC 50983]
MTIPHTPRSVPVYKLLIALFTLIPVSIAYIPLYASPSGAWYLFPLIIAPMWAMFDADFNYQWSFTFWRVTITTAWFAWATGALVHLIATSI